MAKAKKAATKRKPAKAKSAAKGKSKSTALEKIDPRWALFVVAYSDPKSGTFSNAMASAIAAGFSESYAKSITTHIPERVSEIVGNEKRVAKALEHVDEVLEMPIITQAMGAFGPLYEKKEIFVEKQLKNGKKKKVKRIEKVPVMTYNTTRIKEKSKVAEITLQALKRDQWGKKADGMSSFVFNIHPTKDRYRTEPTPVESKTVS